MTDEYVLRKWRELGYEEQERRYYEQPPVYMRSSADVLCRFLETGIGGVSLCVNFEDAGYRTFRDTGESLRVSRRVW